MDTIAHIVKFNSQTNARDKLCRFLQYSSKLAWYVYETRNPVYTQRLKNLETSFSSTRKVLRLGKSLDLIQGALKNLDVEDAVLKLTLVTAKLNQACYLLIDHYVWFSKITKIDENTKYWAKVAARFWLVTIMFNLLRNIYDILNLYDRKQKKLHQVQTNTKPVCVDFTKNVCDLFLPLAVLGYVNTSPGLQGILGMTSSLMGMLQSWNPVYKLSPS